MIDPGKLFEVEAIKKEVVPNKWGLKRSQEQIKAKQR